MAKRKNGNGTNALAVRVTSSQATSLVKRFTDKVVGFIVETSQQHSGAQEFLRELQTRDREFDEARKIEKQPHLDAGREVDATWEEPIKTIRAAKDDLGNKILGFENAVRVEEDRKRRETERVRLEAERKERERLEKQAKQFEKKGDDVAAAKMRDEKALVEIPQDPSPAPEDPKAKGTRRPETWTAVVRPEQQSLLSRAIQKWNADQEDPDKLIMPAAYWSANQDALDKLAQQTKGEAPLDGVMFDKKIGISATRRTR